jgi:hypothetical protein
LPDGEEIMTDSDSSYNATGPSIVAFETTSADTPVHQQFGVSVVGTKCGVYGQGTSGAQKDRRVAPLGAGVCGRGDTEGVYGIGVEQGVLGVSASVDDNGDTPDFGSSLASGGMGVIGISGARSQGDPTLAKDPFNGYYNAPAVVGDNNVLNSDLSKLSVLGNNVVTEIRTLPVGVEGISWSGLGVYGISFNLDPEKKTTRRKTLGSNTPHPTPFWTPSSPTLRSTEPLRPAYWA